MNVACVRFVRCVPRSAVLAAVLLLAGGLTACQSSGGVQEQRVIVSVPPAGAGAPVAPAAAPASVPVRWDAVILLRHAEKQAEGRDPALTDAGRRRADRVAAMLRDAGVTAVHTTPYVRTRQTAAPIAARLGLEPATYDPRRLEAFAASLAGTAGRIVIVGHSNTTPAMVRALGGDPGPPIDDATEFDRLYVLTPGADGTIGTLTLRIPGD